MKTGQLLFDLCQNIEGEYPDIDGEVIELNLGKKRNGYSCCNEYGYTVFLPGIVDNDSYMFQPANQDTVDAFLGGMLLEGDKLYLKVRYDETVENNLKELLEYYKNRE